MCNLQGLCSGRVEMASSIDNTKIKRVVSVSNTSHCNRVVARDLYQEIALNKREGHGLEATSSSDIPFVLGSDLFEICDIEFRGSTERTQDMVDDLVNPATAALQRSLEPPFNQLRSLGLLTRTKERMIKRSSLKRTRSSQCSFEILNLLDAMKLVEEAIEFPSIEWNFDGDSTSSSYENLQSIPPEENELLSLLSRPKRVCRGLVRTKKVDSNLAQLSGMAA